MGRIILLNCMGYVKRKGTKEARKLPADFDEIKSEFRPAGIARTIVRVAKVTQSLFCVTLVQFT